jgi:YgiT-type zinc finger domain-containing protein
VSSSCPLCGGSLHQRTVRHAVVHDGRVIVFDGVPALVCAQCGEPVFAGGVVDQMNRFAWSLPKTPGAELSVHYHNLSAEPALMAG